MGLIRKHRTTDDFIREAREIHGDKYDYSLTVFTKLDAKVKIICPVHGVFEQIARNHLNGAGCWKCKNESMSLRKRMTTEEFIRRAKEKHGDKYDYSLVKYIDSQTKVKIICPIHGIFEQTPNNHLYGYGCKKCSDEQTHEKQRNTTDNFIKNARKVHGDKYDYSKTEYISLSKKVKIICPVHGVFEQYPQNHLKGWGCSKCSQSHLEKEIYKYLKDNNYVFETQKTFPWLKYEKKLLIDFYIPLLNIAIECQGAQHYTPVDFSGHNKERSLEQFELLQKRDNIKQNLCLEHGINLIYYTHEKDAPIKHVTNIEMLDEILKNQPFC